MTPDVGWDAGALLEWLVGFLTEIKLVEVIQFKPSMGTMGSHGNNGVYHRILQVASSFPKG
jgi:hypothetical protein